MKKNFFTVLGLSAVITVAGQGGGPSGPQISGSDPSVLPNLRPPSPEAYKLGSYGNIPVSLFTGKANVNIPLTEFRTKNLSLPVAINYSSNGIKIDDMNGSAGLGWSLITGGVITRTIRDLPDEDNVNITFPTDIDALGIRHPVVMQYFQDASNDLVDSEQDMYMASFNGHSIRFLFDRRGMPVVYSQQDVKIEGRSGGDSFTITTDDGIKYYFTDKEMTNNRTLGDGHSLLSNNTTAWYLTKIEDPSSGENIMIENQNAGYSTTLSNSQTLKYTIGPAQQSVCGGSAFSLPPVISGLVSHLQSVNGKQIRRIYSNNPGYGEIIFDYTPSTGSEDYGKLSRIQKKINSVVINDISFDYTLTANKRLFLNSINDIVSKAVHRFTYNAPEEFPVRLSFARDTGGYYNGVMTNTHLIPQMPTSAISYSGAQQHVVPAKSQIGMLTKVVYPTKGNSEFFYENNTLSTYKVVVPAYTAGHSIGAESTDIDFGSSLQSKSVTFTSIRDEEVILGGGASFNAWKCPQELHVTGKHRGRVTLRKATGELIPFYTKASNGWETVTGTTHTLPVNGSPFYARIPKDIPLTLTITTSFECTRSSVAITYTAGEAEWGYVEDITAGLRISKITDNSESGVAVTRKFLYKDLNEPFASVITASQPSFSESLFKTRTCLNNSSPGTIGGGIPTGIERFTYNVLTSSNIHELNALHPNTFYKTVQEIIEGKSNIVHYYAIDTDYFGKTIYGNNINSAPRTNFGWKNGKEILTKYLDSNNNLVRSVENSYEEDPARKIQIDGFAIRKNYDNPIGMNVTKTCKAADITKTLETTYCTANHSHHYRVADFYKNCYAMGAQNVTQVYKDLCYGRNIGDVIAFDERMDNLDIVQYKNISYFEHLKSQKTTEYLNGTAMKTETQYFYNNPQHTQLTAQKTVFPDLSSTETSYQYAYEKNNPLLISKNIVGLPLEKQQQQTVDNITRVISRTESIYPGTLPHTTTGNLILPLSEHTFDNLSSTVSYKDVNYDKYDQNGNILQYTTKDGTPVSIVWGYHKTKPIAKIVGALYSQVENLIADIVAKSDQDAVDPAKEADLLLALDAFNPTGMKTTYTYDPLIGITTVTPPSGIREVFIYDNANRLQEIQARERDSAGNYVLKKVKEFKYNYKQ